MKHMVGKVWCAIRRKHGKWLRPKGDENKYCRTCGKAVPVNKRVTKIAYG